MFSPIHFCSYCNDDFDPIEGEAPSTEEPSFCSDDCRERYWAAVDAEEAYNEAGTGAPVHL